MSPAWELSAGSGKSQNISPAWELSAGVPAVPGKTDDPLGEGDRAERKPL